MSSTGDAQQGYMNLAFNMLIYVYAEFITHKRGPGLSA